jgi:biotin carboxyl carrier protein
VKYTVVSPETDEVLAKVDDQIDFNGVCTWIRGGQLEVAFADGKRVIFPVHTQNADGSIMVATALGSFRLLASRGVALGATGGRAAHKTIKSSMPGKVLKLLCKPGDKIEAGQPIMIIEAMKMENEIRAPQAGVIEEITVQPGKSIQAGELLVKLGTGES